MSTRQKNKIKQQNAEYYQRMKLEREECQQRAEQREGEEAEVVKKKKKKFYQMNLRK